MCKKMHYDAKIDAVLLSVVWQLAIFEETF